MELLMTPLRQRMIEDMQIRNLSPHTKDSYVQQVSQFARHFGKSPIELCPEDIRTYQVYLTNERKLAPSSILIAVSALRFLYKVTLKKEWTFEEIIPACKRPQKLPTIVPPVFVCRRSAPNERGGRSSGLEHLVSRRSVPGMLHPWARAGSRRFPGGPSYASALLQDPGRADKTSPLAVLPTPPPAYPNRRPQRVHNLEANAGLQHPLSTLHE
jgi:hypothetical protein